eukprot:s4565_g3.t1
MASWKWVSLALMLAQNAITPIVFRYATTAAKAEDRFSTTVSIGCQEALKLFMSFGLAMLEFGSCTAAVAAVCAVKPGDSLRLAVPALLFVLQNAAMQLATVHLPAALFQVLWQGKTLVMAALSVLLLDKRLMRSSWLAICFMAVGIAVVQLSQSKEGKQASMANASEQQPALGLLLVLGGCLCSGFAAIYLEMLVKQRGRTVRTSMWVQNMQLAFYSLLLTSTSTACSMKPVSLGNAGLFRGFSFSVWIMIVNNAIGGLLVALVIKHADNILRGFATALATVLTTIGSVICFGFEIHISFFIGSFLVLGSSLLYGGALKMPGEWWNEDPCKYKVLEVDAADDKISSKLNPEQGCATAGTSSIGCSKGAERVHGQKGDRYLADFRIALSDISHISLYTVEAGAWSIAEFLLQADADMNAPRFDGKTVLMLAVESNKLDLVEAIVNQRAELNLKDEKGASALSITLETKRAGPNQQDLLRILINGQCDMNTICPSRRLPAVTLAAAAGNIEVVEALVQSQANINNVDPMSPVAAAARAEKWRAVQRLVELRADPDLCSTSSASIPNGNMKSENGNENAQATPALILAVKAGEQDLVRFLCSNGASPNLMDDTLSACGCAASANHLGILKLLAGVRADLD